MDNQNNNQNNNNENNNNNNNNNINALNNQTNQINSTSNSTSNDPLYRSMNNYIATQNNNYQKSVQNTINYANTQANNQILYQNTTASFDKIKTIDKIRGRFGPAFILNWTVWFWLFGWIYGVIAVLVNWKLMRKCDVSNGAIIGYFLLMLLLGWLPILLGVIPIFIIVGSLSRKQTKIKAKTSYHIATPTMGRTRTSY